MDTQWTLVWLLGGLGLGLSGLFFALWRRADQQVAAVAEKLEREESAHAQVRTDWTREKKAKARLAEELSEYRKRKEKNKKRQAKGHSAPLGTQSRIQDLEERLEQREQERDRFRAERDALESEQVGLTSTITQLREAANASAESAARAAAAPPPTPAAEASPAVSAESGSDARAAELAEARERIDKLVSEIEIAKATEGKMRKRMANQEQLYASVRAELEVKKDRLRTQEEQIQRLQALEVAISTD